MSWAWLPTLWTHVVKSNEPWFIDACFKGLPIWETKVLIDNALLNEEKWEEIVNKILSWEYNFISWWEKGRYTDNNTWYYVYTFVLDKNWEKENVDVIFYSTTNTKVMVRIKSWFYEVMISEHPEILDLVLKFYQLPVYTKDSSWWVSLANNLIN